jgi:hypothetical protein
MQSGEGILGDTLRFEWYKSTAIFPSLLLALESSWTDVTFGRAARQNWQAGPANFGLFSRHHGRYLQTPPRLKLLKHIRDWKHFALWKQTGACSCSSSNRDSFTALEGGWGGFHISGWFFNIFHKELTATAMVPTS